jgi:hypothetical protein
LFSPFLMWCSHRITFGYTRQVLNTNVLKDIP